MYKVDAQQAHADSVTTEGAANVQIQWLIDESRGAPNFALRRFIVQPGGHTPRHQHPWEHEVYVLRGRGLVVTDEGEVEIGPDQAMLYWFPPTKSINSSVMRMRRWRCCVLYPMDRLLPIDSKNVGANVRQHIRPRLLGGSCGQLSPLQTAMRMRACTM